jgi:uncharacterized protein YcfL
MLERENFKHKVSSVCIIGCSINSAAQLNVEQFCVLADSVQITGQVSEVESYIRGDSNETGPHPPKD